MIAEQVRIFLLTNPVFDDLLPKDLKVDFPLIDSGALDSIGIFELITFLEKSMGVRIVAEDILAANFRDLGTIEKFVLSKRAAIGL